MQGRRIFPDVLHSRREVGNGPPPASGHHIDAHPSSILTDVRHLLHNTAMNLHPVLRTYRQDEFTDDDVHRCTGLSVRAWRELIKIGAVRTITERRGPGRVRLCDATVLKRAAVIAALNRAGFSLAVAGQMALSLPYHTLLYAVCDPCTILLERPAAVDAKPAPRELKQPKTDWFDPTKPATAERSSDWRVQIYDGRFVGAVYKPDGEPWMFGDLRAAGTRFVAWLPGHSRPAVVGSAIDALARDVLSCRFVEYVEAWERSHPQELKRIGYQCEDHAGQEDSLRLAAAATARSAVFCTQVNVSLAIRTALRRYLRLEPAAPSTEGGG